MTTLNDYIIETRDLLHDPNGAFWTNAQLIRYINKARNKTVWATKCLRKLQSLNTVTGQESYPFTLLPQDLSGRQTIDILNITVIWGSQRIPLDWMVYSQFNAYMRTDTLFKYTPQVFTLYGQNQFILGPVPDQVYAMEIDTVINPLPLVSTTDIDEIIEPYTSPVAYYAAHLAYLYQQQIAESEQKTREFDADIQRVMLGVSNRRLFSAYTDRR